MLMGLICTSFANTVWQLILTQGVLYGRGGSICTLLPSFTQINLGIMTESVH
jgi:hypothetical protein